MTHWQYRLQVINSLLLMAVSQALFAGSIVGSKHDLSVAVGGTNEICVFCHTPHNANNDLDNDTILDSTRPGGRPNAPLWNRRITRADTDTFTPYTSSTMNMVCDEIPSPLSLACLSCHDVAMGTFLGEEDYGGGSVSVIDTHNLVNEPNLMGPSSPNCFGCHPDGGQFPGAWWQIGPDLSNDHPVSMDYPAVTDDPDFNAPPNPLTGWGDIKLFNGRVECPSCHNPHDPANVPFLRKTIDGSTLCITCHTK